MIGVFMEKEKNADKPSGGLAGYATPYTGFAAKIDKFFGVTKRGSSIKVELFAGIATFLAMSYILIVNPNQILYAPPEGQVNAFADYWPSLFMATAFGAIIGTLLVSFVAKMPYAAAPGMGFNAMLGSLWGGGISLYGYFYNYSFGNAMLLVLISSILFLSLSFIPAGKDKKTGRQMVIRDRIFNGIPKGLRQAIPVGIGLFVAFIGFQNSGIIVANPYTQVSLIDFTDWKAFSPANAIIALVGLIIIAVLAHNKIKGAVVIGMLAATILGMIPMGGTQVTDVTRLVSNEGGITWAFWDNFGSFFSGDVFFAAFKTGFDFSGAGEGFGFVLTSIMIVISFCMIDMFDTMGTITGCAMRAGLTDADGVPVNYDKCLYADAISALAGAVIGTSTVTLFVESGAGIAEGGKTGLTSLTVALLFLISMFILPFFAMIPAAASASALIYVGVVMMSNVKHIDFSNIKIAVPAFLTIVVMPLGYSITAGIGIGLLSYVVISLACYVLDFIKFEMVIDSNPYSEKPVFDVSVVTIIIAVLFCIHFFVPKVY